MTLGVPLTGGYPTRALARRAGNAVPAGELHVGEPGDVILSVQAVQRVIVCVLLVVLAVLGRRRRVLPWRDQGERAAAAGPPSAHDGTIKPAGWRQLTFMQYLGNRRYLTFSPDRFTSRY